MIGIVCCIRMIAIIMITSIKLYRRAFSMLVALGPGLVLLQGEEHEGFFLLRNVLFIAGRLVMAWRGQGVLRSSFLLVLGWRGLSVLPLAGAFSRCKAGGGCSGCLGGVEGVGEGALG